MIRNTQFKNFMKFKCPPKAPKAQILRIDSVCRKVGLSRQQIYYKMNKGEFPQNFKLFQDGWAVGWHLDEINEWIANHPIKERND